MSASLRFAAGTLRCSAQPGFRSNSPAAQTIAGPHPSGLPLLSAFTRVLQRGEESESGTDFYHVVAINFIAACARITAARDRKHLNNRHAAWFLRSDIVFRTCHDRRRMPCGWFRLSFERYAGSGEAFDAFRQSGPRWCRLRPDVAGNFDRVRIVVAAARDSSNLRPALKGERDRSAAVGAKMNEDLLLASVRDVRIAAQRPGVKYHGIYWKHRLGEVRRPCHSLAKGAVASECTQWRLRGSEPNLSAEATTFESFGHVHVVPLNAQGSAGAVCDD